MNPIWSFSAQMSTCPFVAPGLFLWAPQAGADGPSKGPAELPVHHVSIHGRCHMSTLYYLGSWREEPCCRSQRSRSILRTH